MIHSGRTKKLDKKYVVITKNEKEKDQRKI